jgi:hypothetical protein
VASNPYSNLKMAILIILYILVGILTYLLFTKYKWVEDKDALIIVSMAWPSLVLLVLGGAIYAIAKLIYTKCF